MKKRIGFIGIVIEDRQKSAASVNHLLSIFGELIIARTGIPYRDRNCCVITLIVDATPEELGKLVSQLEALEGIIVKSALGKAECSGN